MNKDIENFFDDDDDIEDPNKNEDPNNNKDAKKKAGTKKPEAINEPGEEEEDEPEFSAPAKKSSKPDKEESIATLRKQRDEYKSKLEEYENSEININSLKPIVEYLQENNEGVIDEETVEAIVTEIKSKDDEIKQLKDDLAERDKKIAEIDIRYSDDFKSTYEKPYLDAAQSLLVEFATVTKDKKIIAPNATKKLHNALMDGAGELAAVDVKALLLEFKKEYEEESGEEANLPTVSSLMKSLREFGSAKATMKDAYENWSTKKEENSKKTAAEKQREQEEYAKASKRERTKLFNRAYKSFDVEE